MRCRWFTVDNEVLHVNTAMVIRDQCIIYVEMDSSPFSACAPMKPRLSPRTCNSHTYFPRHEQNRGGQQSLLTLGAFFYILFTRPVWGRKLICAALHVIRGAPATYLSHSVSLWLFGWSAVLYWSVLFLSCGFETIPALWMSDDSLPALHLDSVWASLTSPALSADVINRKRQHVTSLRRHLTLIGQCFPPLPDWQSEITVLVYFVLHSSQWRKRRYVNQESRLRTALNNLLSINHNHDIYVTLMQLF